MIKNPASFIKEVYEFQCPLCYVTYDDTDKFPMIICQNQHHCCLKCLNSVLFNGKEECDCPFCKNKISKDKPKKFRLLNQIRLTQKNLRVEGSNIRKNLLSLNQEKESMKEQLAKQRQKNQFLIQQMKEKQISINQRHERQIFDLKKQYRQKIDFLENEVQTLKRKLEQINKELIQKNNQLPASKQHHKQRPNQSPKKQQFPEVKLDLSGQELKVVDLSKHGNITRLDIKDNLLTSIDLSKSPRLSEVDLAWNKLTDLNLLQNTNLIYLNAYENQLKTVSIRFTPKLSLSNITLGNQRSPQCIVQLHYAKQDELRCQQFRDELSAQLNQGRGAQSEEYKKYINAYNCKYVLTLKQM